MESDLDAILARYREFFDNLSDQSVEEFREFASPSVRYRDPLMDEKGVDAVVARMHKWFADLDGLRFETEGHARRGRLAFAHWRMTFRINKSPKKLWEMEGVSRIALDEAGRVQEHTDYWDASPLLEAIPVLGRVVTLAKNVVAG